MNWIQNIINTITTHGDLNWGASGGSATQVYASITVAPGDTLEIHSNVHCYGDVSVGDGATLAIKGNCYIAGGLNTNMSGNVNIWGNCEVGDGISNRFGQFTIGGDCFDSGAFENGLGFAHIIGNLRVYSNINNFGTLYVDGKLTCKSNITNGQVFSGSMTEALDPLVMTDSGAGSGAGWNPDELVGMGITNTTDGSSGTITSNTENTITCAGGLSGGLLNTWTLGDQYKVVEPADLSASGIECHDTIINIGHFTIKGDVKCEQFSNLESGFAYSAVIEGDLTIENDGGDLTNNGSLHIDGSLVMNGNITMNGSDLLGIDGDCTCNSITLNGGSIVIGKSLVCDRITMNSTVYLRVMGDCKVANYITTSTAGTINFSGDLDINGTGDGDGDGYLDNTGGASIFIAGDCHIYGDDDGDNLSLKNTTGTVTVSGDLYCAYGIDQTDPTNNGYIHCWGNCRCAGFNVNGTDGIFIYSDLQTSSNGGLTKVLGGMTIGNYRGGAIGITGVGEVVIEGNCYADQILNTVGSLTVWGNCQVPGSITNSGGGIISIRGDLNINGSEAGSGYLDNTGGGAIVIAGDCHIYGRDVSDHSIVNTIGSIEVRGDLICTYDISQTDITNIGSIHVYGDAYCTAVTLDGGASPSISINGDLHAKSIGVLTGSLLIFDCIVSNGFANDSGMIGIMGNCFVGTDMTNGIGIINIRGKCFIGSNLTQYNVTGTVLTGPLTVNGILNIGAAGTVTSYGGVQSIGAPVITGTLNNNAYHTP